MQEVDNFQYELSSKLMELWKQKKLTPENVAAEAQLVENGLPLSQPEIEGLISVFLLGMNEIIKGID